MAAHTSNRFALLASAPTKQPQPRALKDKSTVQAQKAQVAQELKNIKQQEEKTQDVDQNKGAGRGPRGQNNNNRGPRREGDNRGPREGRAQGGDNRGPRKFDRRSGTGRPANEEKKGGHGKQNWGTVTDAVAASGEQAETDRPEGEQADQETPKVEEEPKTFTLAEYEKQLADNQVQLSNDRPPPRVVEEDDVLKSKYVKVEKKHDAFVPGKPKKNKDNKPSTQKKQVIPVSQILDIKQNDSRPQGNRGPRGGKNQNRGQRGQQQSFNLDESAFPKLG